MQVLSLQRAMRADESTSHSGEDEEMKPKGYCPECGKPSNNVTGLVTGIGLGIWNLVCSDCGTWEIQYRK